MASRFPIAVTVLLLASCVATSNAACCTASQLSYFCQSSDTGEGAAVVNSASICSCDAGTCLNSYYANGNVRSGYNRVNNPDTDLQNAISTADAVCGDSGVRPHTV